ncbi:hypothetical protein [Microcoleus sp. D3_18a_C4]|uniref:hypothetical protein n=1 Tax=Microcoleus sp. D3_18a_C4 TaxID=3055332 RepID=UPI002FD20129
MSTETLVNWLEESTELGILSREILQAIAGEMEMTTFPPGFRVVIEDTPVTNLYILERGQADRYRRKQPGLMWASSLLPGAIGVALMGNLSTGNFKVHPNPIQHRSIERKYDKTSLKFYSFVVNCGKIR